ncbi:MAG: serine hydrolase [Candidatus Paceibacterota bacterium]
MRQFFSVLYGGLGMIIALFGIYFGLVWIHDDVLPVISRIDLDMTANAIASLIEQPIEGTSLEGFRRLIRYTASQEEDLINTATLNIPQSLENDITANGYIIRNLDTDEVIAANNADTLMPVASLTKLVTAIVARKLIDPDEHIVLSKSIIDTYGNTAQFRAGEVFLAKDMFYPLLMVSSNDAAEAFAHNYGRKAFIEAMNNFAQTIGAYRTYFRDPSGLSADNRSTATDLAIILDWIRKNDPEILEITDMKTKTVRTHTWVNPSHFLNWSNYYGGKNGYIPEAKLTSAAIFTFGEEREMYAVVLLGSDSRDSDVVKLLSRVK